MIKRLKTAYGAGWRAGMAESRFIRFPNGTKVIAPAVCPFTRRQLLRAFLWHEGHYNGTMEKLTTWLRSKRHG